MSDSKAKATLPGQTKLVRHIPPSCLFGTRWQTETASRRGRALMKEQAQTLVDQANQILADPALWNLSPRNRVKEL